MMKSYIQLAVALLFTALISGNSLSANDDPDVVIILVDDMA